MFLPTFLSTTCKNSSLFILSNHFYRLINDYTLDIATRDVSNNRFTGWIPERLKRINSIRTQGNSWNSGPALPPPPYTLPPRDHGTTTQNPASGDCQKSSISGGGIAGIIISLLVLGSLIAFFLVKRRRSRKDHSSKEKFDLERPFSSMPESNGKQSNNKQSSLRVVADSDR